MLWTMSIILIALWVLALVSAGTVGNWAHLLLLFGLITFALAFFESARRGARRASRPRS